jgi:hypothetical protein
MTKSGVGGRTVGHGTDSQFLLVQMAVGLESDFLAEAHDRVAAKNVSVLNSANSEDVASRGTLLPDSGGKHEGSLNTVLLATEVNSKVAGGHFGAEHDLVAGAEAAVS